jgi:predicted ribosomally synthesized peptide with nif11-like leader
MKGEMIMSKMQELFEKVSKDSTLQGKFLEIVKGTENAGEAATKEKLITFAKEAGFDITLEEMQRFFKDLNKNKKREMLEGELEMVAGGIIHDWFNCVIITVPQLETELT